MGWSMNLDELTWSCHVCDRERPDERISVFSTTKRSEAGIEITQNVRHCNDNPACVEGAKEINFLGKDWR